MKINVDRFLEKIEPCPTTGCWLWTAALFNDGYGAFRSKRAHRIAWRIFHGVDAGELQVLHRCDVPSCVNPNHLFLGTTQDNTADKVRKGRTYVPPVGPYHHRAKLTLEQVEKIRRDKRIHRIIAKDYGVAQTVISSIIRGASYTLAQAVSAE